MQKSFKFDINKCDGCNACQLACTIENNLPLEKSWRSVYTFNTKKIPSIPSYHLSLACNHCLDAPCLKNCPSLAYTRDSNTGAVILDGTKCTGCKYCSWQCPYNAPSYSIEEGIMQKCTFCLTRILEGKNPACVTACPTNALKFEDYLLTKTFPPGFPDVGLKPSIDFIDFRKRTAPIMVDEEEKKYITQIIKINREDNNHYNEIDRSNERSAKSPTNVLNKTKKRQVFTAKQKKDNTLQKIREEFPLIIFTFIITILFSSFASNIFFRDKTFPVIFTALSFIGLGVGFFHLGKKKNAYRIIYNIKNSWLSREIFSFSIFICFSICYFIFHSVYLHVFSVFSGAFALFSVDMIYRTKSRIYLHSIIKTHSAETMLTALFFLAIISENLILITLFSLIKIYLYVHRKYIFYLNEIPPRILISIIRLCFGFLFPISIIIISSEAFENLWLISVVTGELIDRSEFYLELEFIDPIMAMENELKNIISENFHS